MAFTAVIGLAAGTTAVTVVTVAAAVVEIGVALTIVGAVTGNKNLMKVGGMMTLVGGGVGMIAGAGGAAAGAAAGEAGAAGVGEAAVGEAGSSFASSVGDGLATDAMGATVSESSAAATLADGSGLGSMADLSAMNPTDTALANGTKASPGGAESVTPDITAGTPQAPDSTIVADNTTVSAPTNTDLTPATQTDTGLSSRTDILNKFNAPTSTSDFFGGISNFAKNNKDLIGSAMKGMADQSNADRKYELDKQYLDQKSFGNQVANFAPRGILSGARQ